MKKTNKICLLVIAISMVYPTCGEKNSKINESCLIDITNLLQIDSNRLQVNARDKSGNITQLVDRTDDSVTTGAYYFYSNGNLKSYKFFSSKAHYQYNEEYDSLGNIILIEGSPLVFRAFRQIDSSIVRFTFFFSALHKEYKNVHFKTNNGIQFTAELLPNSVFTNIKSVTFDLPVAKTFNNIEIYTRCQLTNKCLNEQWTLMDTARFANIQL